MTYKQQKSTVVGTLHMLLANGQILEEAVAAGKNDSVGKSVDSAMACYYEGTGACVEDNPNRIVKLTITLFSLTHYNAGGVDPTTEDGGM